MSITNKIVFLLFVSSAVIFYFTPTYNYFITADDFWKYRVSLLYFSGVAAVLLMVVSMILSLRIDKIDNKTGGLDKSYKIHKTIGMLSFIMVLIHWLLKKSKDIILYFNLLEPAPKSVKNFSELESFLYHLGNDIVSYTVYIFAAIMLIALIRKIPYNIFRFVHKFMPYIFLLIAYHAFTIQIRGYWIGSMGSIFLNFILLLGVISAVLNILKPLMKNKKYSALIKNIKYYDSADILEINLEIEKKQFHYKAGQFIFIQFSNLKEPHPFSISSYNSNEITVSIKQLGDFTSIIKDKIKTGDSVIIQGPYGNFTFDDTSLQQIWIGAGIGVTPFLARLDYLCGLNSDKHIDFYYTNRGKMPYLEKIKEQCRKTNTSFYHIDTLDNKRINLNDIFSKYELQNVSIWFCGSLSLRKDIIKELKKRNYNMKNFHYEEFKIR